MWAVALLVTSGVATLFSWMTWQLSRDFLMTCIAPLLWGSPLYFFSAVTSEAATIRSAVAAVLLASFDTVSDASDVQRWAARVLCAFTVINWASRCRHHFHWSTLFRSYFIGVQFVGGHRLVCETLATLGVHFDHRRLYGHLLLFICWVDVATVLFNYACDTVQNSRQSKINLE